MFQIQVSDTDVTGGSIPITWCMDKELINHLAISANEDPQLLIVVSPVDNYTIYKESRMVVPLKDLIAYVSFHQSGKLNIRGFITNSSRSQSKSRYLSKYDGEYESTVLENDGSDWHEYLRERVDGPGNKSYSKFSAPVVVDVPQQSFAKEPPQWEKDWVNHFFTQRPNDQCDYRKRRMFAYLIQPFIMFFNLLIRAAFLLFALMVGARAITINDLLHPLTYPLSNLVNMLDDGIIFISNKNYYSSTDTIRFTKIVIKKYWKLILSPPFLILMALIICSHMIVPFAIVIAFISFIGLCIGTIFILVDRFSSIRNFVERMIRKLESSNTNSWYEDKESIELLSCDGKTKTLSTLPYNRKSIKLRFLDVKSKVCRPFSK